MVLQHGFANERDSTLNVCYAIRGERWPEPTLISDLNPIFAGQVQIFPLSISVPDTAAAGSNRITWGVACFGGSTCSYRVVIPELIAAAEAQSSAARVRLSWTVADSSADTATVYRQGPDSTWTRLGEVAAGSDARLNFVDEGVEPGTTYDYRLGLPVEDRQIARGWVRATVPDLLADAVVESALGRLTVTWVPDDSLAFTAKVYRRREGHEWMYRGRIVGSATTPLVYEDLSVVQGVRYHYRIGIDVDGRELFRGEVEGVAPIASNELGLESLDGNPTHGAASVVVTKGDSSPAQLHLVDVTGRIVVAQALPAAAGRFEIDVSSGRRLAAGIYYASVIQGHIRRTLRLTVL